MIPKELYTQVLANLPILCVDAVIKNAEGQFLLVKRANEPLKGEWWTVGGRVLIGETALTALTRKVKEELGVEIEKADFIGVYEDFFDRNSFVTDTLYHTVSLVFDVKIKNFDSIVLDSQSLAWTFVDKIPDRLIAKTFR